MEKFKSTSDTVMVNGETILSFVNALPAFKDDRLKLLEKYGIFNPTAGKWYNQQQWLNAFKDISVNVGETNLRIIGKAIIKNAKFPPISNMKEAMESINKAYMMNHSGGSIVYYKLISIDENNKKIIMETNTPYPTEFDNGIFLGVFDKFKPQNYLNSKCISKLKSDNVYTHDITWS